jgi:hypothetical protein
MTTILNKKRVILILLFTIGSFSFAQIKYTGIGTTDPKATLHLVGKPRSATTNDGIIPPKLRGNQLKNKTYNATDHDGAIVYVTEAVTNGFSGQTRNVNDRGFYYFDGPSNLWVSLKDEVVTPESGSEVKKLQYFGAYNSSRTIINGPFEFRIVSNSSSGIGTDPYNSMAYEMRPIFVNGSSHPGFNINASIQRSIGDKPLNGVKKYYSWSSYNTSWQKIGVLSVSGNAQLCYVSVKPTSGASTPIFYVINAQRIGNNSGDSLKSLIITRY